ncbi:DUF2752 domain-containing protein [soil metagenome]|nr:DUF2752 domain-containing protein [Rubrobacter sp.]
MRATSAGERLISASILVLAVGALGFLYLVNPASSSLIPPCPFRAITGCYCPGCGSVRALHQLARGHLVAALGLNPLMVLSLPFVAYHGVSQAKFAVTGLPLRRFFVGSRWIWGLLCLILVYGVLRNIPLYPFDLLAP